MKRLASTLVLTVVLSGCGLPWVPQFLRQSSGTDLNGVQHEELGLADPWEQWNQGQYDMTVTLARYAPRPDGYPAVQPDPGDWIILDVPEVLAPGSTPGDGGGELTRLLEFPCLEEGAVVFDVTVTWMFAGTSTVAHVTSGLRPQLVLNDC
jgi:hypothetical protein